MRMATAALAGLLVLGGCQLFSPRDAEEPDSSSGQFLPQSDWRNVVENLKSAIALKSAPHYVLCFSDGTSGLPPLTFIPSSEGSTQYGSVFVNWTAASEGAYFEALAPKIATSTPPSLVLLNEDARPLGDTTIIDYDYILDVPHTEASFPKTAVGHMQISIGRSSANNWAIFRWADFSNSQGASWSLFKGRFGN
jgi:hypothetical protein